MYLFSISAFIFRSVFLLCAPTLPPRLYIGRKCALLSASRICISPVIFDASAPLFFMLLRRFSLLMYFIFFLPISLTLPNSSVFISRTARSFFSALCNTNPVLSFATCPLAFSVSPTRLPLSIIKFSFSSLASLFSLSRFPCSTCPSLRRMSSSSHISSRSSLFNIVRSSLSI